MHRLRDHWKTVASLSFPEGAAGEPPPGERPGGDHGNVHRHRELGAPTVVPGSHLLTGFTQDPVAQANDLSGFLRDRDDPILDLPEAANELFHSFAQLLPHLVLHPGVPECLSGDFVPVPHGWAEQEKSLSQDGVDHPLGVNHPRTTEPFDRNSA